MTIRNQRLFTGAPSPADRLRGAEREERRPTARSAPPAVSASLSSTTPAPSIQMK